MGIPFSREINRAFEELDKVYGQITPLVASAYEVLETTKNISLLVAGIQILSIILLGLILLALVGLMITMNPDLEKERKELVTPVLKWLTTWTSIVKMSSVFALGVVLMVAVVSLMVSRRIGPFADQRKVSRKDVENENEEDDGEQQSESDEREEK